MKGEGFQNISETYYDETKRQEPKLKVAGVKMRFSLGVTRMDRIREECVRETAQVELFGHKG